MSRLGSTTEEDELELELELEDDQKLELELDADPELELELDDELGPDEELDPELEVGPELELELDPLLDELDPDGSLLELDPDESLLELDPTNEESEGLDGEGMLDEGPDDDDVSGVISSKSSAFGLIGLVDISNFPKFEFCTYLKNQNAFFGARNRQKRGKTQSKIKLLLVWHISTYRIIQIRIKISREISILGSKKMHFVSRKVQNSN